jgi:hypothetical protein
MKNVQKHFQDFSAHSNLKDASTSSRFNSFPRFRKMQKCFEGMQPPASLSHKSVRALLQDTMTLIYSNSFTDAFS